jgi:cytidylate kinase
LTRLAESTDISFRTVAGVQRIWVNGVDRSTEIRSPEVTAIVSEVSAVRGVRTAMVRIQREIAGRQRIVMEGRDIGSYVFPNATYKFFLTASPEERGKRRYLELREKGVQIELDRVVLDLERRDRLDSERDLAPLVKSEGAVEIDTTDLTIDQVLDKMVRLIV